MSTDPPPPDSTPARPPVDDSSPSSAPRFCLNHYYWISRKQETALAQLVWQICLSVRTQRHSEQLAERTFSYLLKREQRRREVEKFEFDDAAIAKIAAEKENQQDVDKKDDDIVLSSSGESSPAGSPTIAAAAKRKTKKKEAGVPEIDSDLEFLDVDEMEAAVNAAYQAAIVRSKHLPQPPLPVLSEEEQESL